MHYLTRRETFNAAHRLGLAEWDAEKNFSVFGKCSYTNWHGHNYVLYVTVAGDPDPVTGFVVDAKRLRDLMKEYVTEDLDHRNLNLDVDWFKGKQPTTENLTSAIYDRLRPHVESLGAKLYCVKLYETENIFAEYYGPSGKP